MGILEAALHCAKVLQEEYIDRMNANAASRHVQERC